MPKCSALYNHEYVSITGNRSPCCRFLENRTEYSVHTTSIKDYHNLDFINSIKKTMETGWHTGCYKCKKEEDGEFSECHNK